MLDTDLLIKQFFTNAPKQMRKPHGCNKSYCGGLQLLAHLLDMAEHKQTRRILECIKNSVLMQMLYGQKVRSQICQNCCC